MYYVIIYRDHCQEEIFGFHTEQRALEFIEVVGTDPDVRCELVYEER